MTFPQIYPALIAQGRARRSSWRYGLQFISLNRGSSEWDSSLGEFRYQIGDSINAIPTTLFERGAEGTATRLPNFNHYGLNGATTFGWTPSQADLLADDWEILS